MMTGLLDSYLPAYVDDESVADIVDPRPSITCGHCGQTRRSVFAVRECHAGATIAPCDDMVIIDSEDGPMVVPCGWEAAYTDQGFRCDAGHSYVDIETREREGWDYADDAYDAAVITKGGRNFVPGGPNTSIDEREVAHILSHL